MKKLFLLALLATLSALSISAQDVGEGQSCTIRPHALKRYNVFFESGASNIDYSYCGNVDIILRMQEDIESTLKQNNALLDSLLITSSSSPDGDVELNRRLAEKRAAETKRVLLQLFPQLKDAAILINHHEASWDGLEQILKTDKGFPQAAEMLSIINSDMDESAKEAALRGCTEGWDHMVSNHLYSLRSSSITVKVAFDGKVDEYVQEILEDETTQPEPVTVEEAKEVEEVEEEAEAIAEKVEEIVVVEETAIHETEPVAEVQFTDERSKKMIMAARSNLLTPAMSIGVEIPILNNWSIGLDYYYPWLLPKNNRWCLQTLAAFAEIRYWIPGKSYKWTDDQRLMGHSVGIYGGVGYYDYQISDDGIQGEFIDFGVDYTFALPIAEGKIRMEFNLGLGFVRSWYRPYYMSSDYSDLIKEPGILYNTTNFIGPTRAGVSLVIPIRVQTKVSKAERKGGKR